MVRYRHVKHLEPGVNVFGYLFAEHGVGEVARLLVQCIRQAGIPYSAIPYTDTGARQEAPFSDFGAGESIHDVNIIVVNADSLPSFLDRFGTDIVEGRYNIGVWAWEVEALPTDLADSARYLDEIWAISRFTADAIAGAVQCPVFPFPLSGSMRQPPSVPRQELGLGDDFLFLFCFDFNSLFDRKNPLGAITAFELALPTGRGARLLIKTTNGFHYPQQLERLNSAALGHPSITIVDGYLTTEQQSALMNACDAYLSLHRSEGFGLTLLEAMAFGKPVIATAYSGNLDFMTEDNSYLVPYRMVGIPSGCGPYPDTSNWADPDLEAAAKMMRRVLTRRDEARDKAGRARMDVERLHSPAVRARLISERLQAIRNLMPGQRAPRRGSQGRAASKGGGTYAVVGNEQEIGARLSGHTSGQNQHAEFESIKDLLGAQLARFTMKDVRRDLLCGSFDGAKRDESGAVSIWGWAFDPRSLAPARSVVVLLNQRQISIRVPVCSPRPDVASFLENPALCETGWSLSVPSRLLAEGTNVFEAYAVLEDGRLGLLSGAQGQKVVLDEASAGGGWWGGLRAGQRLDRSELSAML